jgi:hypothetical protein
MTTDLPLELTMPSFAANLAVVNGETLAGKVTLAPALPNPRGQPKP